MSLKKYLKRCLNLKKLSKYVKNEFSMEMIGSVSTVEQEIKIREKDIEDVPKMYVKKEEKIIKELNKYMAYNCIYAAHLKRKYQLGIVVCDKDNNYIEFIWA